MIEAAYRTLSRVPPPRSPRILSSADKGCLVEQPVEKPDLDAQSAGFELLWTADYTLTVNPDMSVDIDGERHGDSLIVPYGTDYYVVLTGQQIVLPAGFNALALPHPRFFDPLPAGAFHDTPHVVPRAYAADNWPRPLSLLCVRPRPGTQHIFYSGEPYAQIIPIPRAEIVLREMSAEETLKWKDRQAFVEARDQQLGGYEGFLKKLRKVGWDELVNLYPLPDSEALA